MTRWKRFDPNEHTVGLDRRLLAALVPAQPDPPVPVDGYTFGVAHMERSADHGGECHPDGDEVLYLVSGQAQVVIELPEGEEVVAMQAGDGLIVPQGVWHRVDILQPSCIVYLTPGPHNEFRLAENEAGAGSDHGAGKEGA